MNNQNKDKNNSTKHLDDALYNTTPASANDRTGYVPFLPENNENLNNLSQLLNVPTSPHIKKKKK